MSQPNRKYKRLEALLSEPGRVNPEPGIVPEVNQELNELKAQVARLKSNLAGQSGTTDEGASTPVLEAALQSLPAKSIKQSHTAAAQRLTVTKRPSSENPTSNPGSAFLISALIAVAHIVAAPYYLYLGRVSGFTQFNTLSIISFVLGILFGIGSVLSRRGQSTAGILLVLGTLAVSYPPIATLAAGLGLVLGSALMFAGPMIAFQFLSRRSSWVMTITTVVSGLITLLLDVYGSVGRPALPGFFIQLLAVSVVGVLGFSLVRQFRNYSLSTKLVSIVALVFFLLAAIEFQVSNVRGRKQLEAQAEERLSGYYQVYVGRVAAESNAAGALASSIASRTDVQQLYLKNDREGLYALLLPMFENLKQRQIVHLYIENPDGTVFLRVHNPKNFGDDVTYRGTAADALSLRETTSGVEMGPNRMGVRGVAPMYSGDQFIGVIEVGLDFDERFIADLKELTGADFTMWVTYESAAFPDLKPAEDIPNAPIEELFYYASTSSQTLPVNAELYRSALATKTSFFQAVTEKTSNPSIVYITPLLGYKGKLFGLLEISFPYTETLNALQASRITSLGMVTGLATAGLFLIMIATSQFVLKPIQSLTQFANLQMSGETHARVSVPSTDEFGQLAETFNSLANSLEEERRTLEQRVVDRTHDLELASEVGRTITQKIADINEVLTSAVEMIRARFNLYYTQVYLTDPAGRLLVLRAGTGQVGNELLKRGHRLLIDSGSLNGQAVFQKKPVIVVDTVHSLNFKPNQLLPNTRSEMAVPLIVGDQVIGVLDMQSEQPGSLNETNLAAFEALAGQLAVALQNAALFAQAEEARSEVEAQVRHTTETGWQDFLNAIERGQRMGYAFDQLQVFPLKAEFLNLKPFEGGLSAPLNLTGANLGMIQIANEPGHVWASRDIEVTHAVAAQLAHHVDSLRLLTQAEKYRSEAEQAVRRVMREGWSSYLQMRSKQKLGYTFDLIKVESLPGDTNGNSKHAIKYPLLVRHESIGELAVEKEAVSDDGQEIIEAVTRQLSGHIENLRLSEQIEKRATELQTVATLSSTTSTLLDPDKLLQTIVDLTKERFSLYHAHIYLVSESRNTLLLAVGSGEVGRQMVSDGWNIPLNHQSSIVADAARNRTHIIANDVFHDKESSFLSNRLLPDTRSEMAVPMIVGEEVLGVFDVQSDVVGRFTEEDANIYNTLAAQVGVALQNARLYVEQAATVTQLRELDRLKSAFLANMSHELRTPLNSILGFADVMLEELDGPLTDYMNNDLRLIQKNGQHLLHLINDVLDMAKIEAGRMNLNPEKFRVYEVVDEVISITSTLASEKNLALFLHEETDQEVEIFADRTRLRQVLINLVNNSIKFTEKGRISVKVSAMDGARVLLRVKDTGIGIPPDKLDAVFQEFTQVDTSTTRKVGGTGLGLPISRRLVEMHGGRLWAESTGIKGEGASFLVELPVEARITEVIEKMEK